jgi:cobalamin biosynthesis Mg chelatase CobN
VRVGGFLALVILSAAVLSSDACAHRRYTMRVTETAPTPAPRRSAAASLPEARARAGAEQGSERLAQTSASDALPAIVATSGGQPPRPQAMNGSAASDSERGSPVVPHREPSTTAGASEEGAAVSQHDPGPGSPSVGEPVSLGLVVGGAVIALLLLIAAVARRQVRA